MSFPGGSDRSPAASPLRVAVLAGGRSSEHDVSLTSAAAVRDGLQAAGHEVVWIEIARDGSWTFQDSILSVTPGGGLQDVDLAFPVLHGPFGEDGTVQGLLEMLDVAYVGAGVAASAVCMDKVLFKDLLSAAGLPQVRYAGVRVERHRADPEGSLRRLAALALPVFVKPAHLGSSVGIVKVSEPSELGRALEEAFVHDALAIVEEAAPGKEVECGVLGTPGDGAQGAPALGMVAAPRPAPQSSEPGEIVFSGEFYDYEAKYRPGGMELLIPARISPAAQRQVRELALRTFELVGCEGLARVDFFVDGEQVLVNELNTMPGFTPTSVYAKLFEASGVAYPELVDRLCRLALERHRGVRALSH